uniref:Cyclin N-terminal domain-containing protein n=1 Tax=Mycena chlorophos TaxID=658473 RepID=A0ABQ0M1Z3_MYCCL|nr:predicted protein [Mycena chlorophos]
MHYTTSQLSSCQLVSSCVGPVASTPSGAATASLTVSQRPSSMAEIETSLNPAPPSDHAYTANLCARFITHLFGGPSPPASQLKLSHFIAYALHRTELDTPVPYAALLLLQRLKGRHPSASGPSGHRLFLSALIVASKLIDAQYSSGESNAVWCDIAQGMFSLPAINQMEREFCTYLDGDLAIDDAILAKFQVVVDKDFGQDVPMYPTYAADVFASRAPEALSSSTPNSIPSSGHQMPTSSSPLMPSSPRSKIVEPSSSSSLTPSFAPLRSSGSRGHGK